jgi:predicted GTPase
MATVLNQMRQATELAKRMSTSLDNMDFDKILNPEKFEEKTEDAETSKADGLERNVMGNISDSHNEFRQIISKLTKIGMSKEAERMTEVESLLDIDLSSFRVVVVGQQNSGKSTLLNVLCERLDLDWFETGDRIVTKDIKEKEHKGIVYVDTPGLGTTDTYDDMASVRASKGACVILFAHSCVLGELSKEECTKLSEFARELEEAEKQLIVLCCKDGEIIEQEELDKIVNKVRKQIQESTARKIKALAIDSLDYITGKKESEAAFVKQSNIPQLLQWVNERRGDTSNKAEARFEAVRTEITGALRKRKAEIIKEKSQIQTRYDDLRSKLLSKWSGELVPNTIRGAWRKCVEIKSAIASL